MFEFEQKIFDFNKLDIVKEDLLNLEETIICDCIKYMH